MTIKNKKIKLNVTFLVCIISLMIFSNQHIYTQTTVDYVESNEVVANPERGLQKYSITNNNYNTRDDFSSLSQSTLTGWRNSTDRVTVIFRYFLLDNFLSTNISQRYLNNIQNDFDIIRNAGLKCLVRFSYSNGITNNPQQPNKAQILIHLNQLTPVLEANKDIILTHQAGFIGTWGEWYYTRSEEFGDEGKMNNTQWNNRKDIIDAMLSATPAEIPLQVRYPEIKKKMYGNTQLNASTAYQNTPNARIGFYNDAFLNAWGDMGTYSISGQNQNPVGTADYNYLANETKYTPMTGETNGINAPRTDATNAIYEMGLTHWTCINRDYHGSVWNNWRSSGSYDEILRKTGYRFVLSNSTFSINDANLNIQINIENKGFARLFKERNAYLVLKNTSNNQTFSFELNTDPRTWESTVAINQNIDISSLPIGSYNSYLHLPDIHSSLASRSEYAIRLANANVWDANTGYNNLNQVIVHNTSSYTSKVTDKDALKIAPNPFSTQTIITVEDNLKNGSMSLFDTNGKLIYSLSNLNGKSFSLYKNQLSEGIYFIQIEDKDRLLTSKLYIN